MPHVIGLDRLRVGWLREGYHESVVQAEAFLGSRHACESCATHPAGWNRNVASPPKAQPSGDTTPYKVTSVIIHGGVSPEARTLARLNGPPERWSVWCEHPTARRTSGVDVTCSHQENNLFVYASKVQWTAGESGAVRCLSSERPTRTLASKRQGSMAPSAGSMGGWREWRCTRPRCRRRRLRPM